MADPASPTPSARFDPGGLVYGALAVATVIAAESTRQETFARLLEASAVTMVLYWVAHAYAHHWALRIREAETWSAAHLAESLAHESPILAGAALPAAGLLIAWAAGAQTEDAVTAVLWVAAIELVVLEVGAALRHHLRLKAIAGHAVVSIALGLGILALRIVLH